MPVVAAALLPHPPLLVPELTGGSSAELDPLRAACRAALESVVASSATTVLVGTGPVWGVPEPTATGSFRPYGADIEATLPALLDLDLPALPPPARLADLPLSLAVAAHLLSALDPPPASLFAATVPASLGPGAATTIGQALASATPTGRPAGVGLVVMGDLSACRTQRAPGGFRPEADEFDASVAEALREGRPERLLELDPGLAADLLVAGRVPLQILAGALKDGPAPRAQILYEGAPYGVGYLVALLTAP